jgi:hypothetical protein
MKTTAQKLEDRLEGNFQSLGAPRDDMAERMGLQGPTLHTAALDADAIIGHHPALHQRRRTPRANQYSAIVICFFHRGSAVYS